MAANFPMIEWAAGGTIYEANIRQYTPEGNFAAFRQHLPRLRDMGVSILWFMPVTPISQEKRQGTLGSYYACSSYVQTNPEFGTLDEFKQLVAEAHALGMKVILDWVANHTGWDHEWTVAHPNWYRKNEVGDFTEENGWVDVIDLDYSVIAMREAMIAAMQFWITQCDIDGFRCDMAHLVPLNFWQNARAACDGIKPLFWLAECDVPEYHAVFDVTYAWEWMHATEEFAKGEDSLAHTYSILQKYSNYPGESIKLFFTTNHDENSWNGSEYEKYGKAALPWAVFTATWPGMQLIYSGQEAANNKRLLFFDKDLIEWNYPSGLAGFYTALSYLRQNPAVRQGEVILLEHDRPNNIIAFLRHYKGRVVLVVLNVSKESKLSIHLHHPLLTGNFVNLFSRLSFSFNGTASFELQEGEFIVYSLWFTSFWFEVYAKKNP